MTLRNGSRRTETRWGSTMIADVKPQGSGYLVRVRGKRGKRILGPYPSEAEAVAVLRDAMEQRKRGRL